MNKLQPKQGGGILPAPYISPELILIGVCVEQGFAGSGGWEENPTIGEENPLDPYAPSSYETY